MAGERRPRRGLRVGPALRLAVIVLRPILMTFTKRDWRGTENLRGEGGIVLAANHLSWFDPIVISHVLWDNGRPPRFLAKDSLFGVRGLGWVMRDTGQIPVVRGTRDAAAAVQAAVAAAEAGECVIVYPEGTITKDPRMWPAAAKTGAARVALTSRRPLIPMAHWGAQEVMGPYRKELRLLPRKTMRVSIGRPVPLDDLYGRPLDAETLRTATDRLMAAIVDLLADIRGERPPAQPAATEGAA